MIPAGASGHFVAGTKGRIFVLARLPPKPPAGCVLVVPPFAEEMNKCRRMVAEVTLGLAERGWASIVPDLYGTGDSEGDFGDAEWTGWADDLSTTVRWCGQQGLGISGLLAVRLGVALAASSAFLSDLSHVRRSVLWQPVLDGNRFLQQFLRLRVAAALLEDDRKETPAELRARLKGGERLEVAGYELSGGLAQGLEGLAVPDSLPSQWGDVTWMEVVRDPAMPLAESTTRLMQRSELGGRSVVSRTFPGEPFWSATEIVRNEAMIAATVAILSGASVP